MEDVIITAPHAMCTNINTNPHPCDYISKRCAKELHKLIPSSKYIEANVPRYDCDLNRIECFNTPFQQRVLEEMSKAKYPLLHLDIHSFPDGDFNGVDIAILVIYRYKHSLSASLNLKYIIQKNIPSLKVSIVEGSDANSLIMYSQSMYDGVALLIEFNERTIPLQFEIVMKTISAWVKKNTNR